MLELLLFTLGLLWSIEFIQCFCTHAKSLLFSKQHKSIPGSWALITACTDGIGRGFALHLAKLGYNIIQVGRNKSKLEECGQDLKSKYGVQVKNVVSDFSLCTQKPIDFFTNIFEETRGLDIRIVVNNVGTNYAGKLSELSHFELNNHIALNLFPIVFLTRLYMNNMKETENYWFINLSSIAAEFFTKNKTIYSACKAFDLAFSEVLLTENLKILALQPGFVDTPLSSARKFRPLLISANECAESAINLLGVVEITGGHWKHVIKMLILKLVRPIIPLISSLT